MVALSALFDSPEMMVRVLIAISSFIFSFSLLKIDRLNFGIKILILLFPWVTVNYIMTLRQGLALSLFMYAYFHGSRNVKVFIYFLVPLIHYLFWIVIGLLGIRVIIKNLKISVGVVGVSFLSIITLMLLVLFFSLLNYDLFAAGELQNLLAGYRNKLGFDIGFGWIFWLLVLILFGSQRIGLIKGNYLSFAFLVLYLVFAPFFPPVSRIMQVGAPIILVAALGKTGLSGGHRISLLWMIVFHIFYFFTLSIKSGGPGGMIS